LGSGLSHQEKVGKKNIYPLAYWSGKNRADQHQPQKLRNWQRCRNLRNCQTNIRIFGCWYCKSLPRSRLYANEEKAEEGGRVGQQISWWQMERIVREVSECTLKYEWLHGSIEDHKAIRGQRWLKALWGLDEWAWLERNKRVILFISSCELILTKTHIICFILYYCFRKHNVLWPDQHSPFQPKETKTDVQSKNNLRWSGEMFWTLPGELKKAIDSYILNKLKCEKPEKTKWWLVNPPQCLTSNQHHATKNWPYSILYLSFPRYILMMV
jgi:hypothetical protein